MMKPETVQGRRGIGPAALLTLAASLIYGIGSGIRANYGVLLGLVSQNSGVDYASVSFVLAVAQLSFGIMQPVFGILSMKRSSAFVLRCGIGLLAAGLLLVPFCKSLWTLLAVLGLLLPSGTAALSFGIVMGILTAKLSRQAVSAASGVVTASSGIGSTVLSPVIQALSAALGLLGTMVCLSVPALLLLPATVFLCRPAGLADGQRENAGLVSLVRDAVKNRGYRFLIAGFFTCGFHMAIIETHLYTQITAYGFPEQTAAYALAAYGAATLVGCIVSGWLCGRFPMSNILGGLYASRVAMVAVFLLLPKTTVSVFGFVILLGITGNATVPPASGITERLFGAAKLAALFGVVFFAHQIGSFFSAWLGGVCLSATGGYTVIWLADAGFSAAAAAVSFLIRSNSPYMEGSIG